MRSLFHERLRYARKAAGLSQSEVAESLGVTRNAVSLWETEDDSKRTEPDIWKLLAVCRKINADMVGYMLNDSADVDDIVPFGLDAGTEVGLANALRLLMKVPREVREAAEALCLQPGGALTAARMLLAVIDSKEARRAQAE